MVCGYVHAGADAHGSQRHTDPLELELQTVLSCPTCVLEVKLGSFARAVLILTFEHFSSFITF